MDGFVPLGDTFTELIELNTRVAQFDIIIELNDEMGEGEIVPTFIGFFDEYAEGLEARAADTNMPTDEEAFLDQLNRLVEYGEKKGWL